MSEVIKRVARAIFKSDVSHGICKNTWSTENEHDRRLYREDARAAIEAMREPTEAMIKAGNTAGFKTNVYSVSSDVWRAMIDAALKNESEVIKRVARAIEDFDSRDAGTEPGIVFEGMAAAALALLWKGGWLKHSHQCGIETGMECTCGLAAAVREIARE